MEKNRENSGNSAELSAGIAPVAFGDARFDARTGELHRNGGVARLTPKAAALLAALLERAPELVTKEELFARVWDGKAVGDEALTSCIQELRRALDDDARQPRFIETRHRRGYRLIVPPSATQGAPALNVPVPPGRPSLAVLPFDSLSGDRDQDYFADGIVEDMTTALSRIGAFFVVGRGSSFTFKGRDVPTREVGRQLGARYIVEGSVRRAGQTLRLTVQLIDAETDHHLWADHYDGEMADVFDLQDRIVGRIVGAISPSVRAAEIARARHKRPDSLQAYDYLLRAQPGFQSILDPGHAEAIKLFHKALELEPGYALAMAQAAWGHSQRFQRLMSPDVASDRRLAVDLANAAIARAPDDPGVLIAAGQALLNAGLNEYADRCTFLFRKALELDPNSAPARRRLGGLHLHRLEPAEAIDAFEQAQRLSPLDPMSFFARFGIGDAHLIQGRLEVALQFYQQALSERPRDHLLQRRVCALLAITGETEQARRMAREILADYPHLTLKLMASVSRPTPQREIIFEGLRLAGFPDDDARQPLFIETRHRRGDRLMVPVTEAVGTVDLPAALVPPAADPSKLVGRAAEMAELQRRLELALSGQRQLVLVTGEPGIGKSALASVFTDRVDRRHVKVTQGQCLDHHGAGEPYLPLIEALTRLAAAPDGAAIRTALATHAPSWLAQMPSLWSRSDRRTLEARGRATRERMLRELTHAVEAISSDSPLVLKLEDIHWSDASTLDWLVHVARRPEPARLMVLATFRPADAAAIAAGLGGITSELAVHGRCHEISLSPLRLEAIEAYLAARLGDGAQLHETARVLLDRTGGNPLFMVGIVNQLAQHSAATPDAIGAIPPDVRRFIERQIDSLEEADRTLLTAASVIRREFATAAVAAALEMNVEQIEAACARLARLGVFIVRSGADAWPDGTPTELYAFRHDLYRELLYERLSATRRAQSHVRVGARLEAAWATRPDAIAAEIAAHFERGHQLARAIPHHQRAAAKALRRSANQEAINHLRRALGAIGHMADGVERTRVEAELQVAMGAAFGAIRGFGAPEVHEAYVRAEALCDGLGERADIFPALWGQWLFRWGRSEMDACWRLASRLLALAEESGSTGLKLQAHHAMWATSYGRGELAQVRTHVQAGLGLYEASVHQAMASSYGNHDASTCGCNFLTQALALEGDEERTRTMLDSTLADARGLDDPFSLAITLYASAAAAQILGDVPLAARNAEECMRIATEHVLPLQKAQSAGVMGWCVAENGERERGLAMLNDAIAALRATQSRSYMPYLLGLLADARGKAGRHAEALTAVEEAIALVDGGAERFYAAELYRLHGVLSAHPSLAREREAEASLCKAVAIARQQGARTLERKAQKSLQDLAS